MKPGGPWRLASGYFPRWGLRRCAYETRLQGMSDVDLCVNFFCSFVNTSASGMSLRSVAAEAFGGSTLESVVNLFFVSLLVIFSLNTRD